MALGRELCTSLKTVVLGNRLFPPGHPTAVGYVERLQKTLREFLEREGEFRIEVTSAGLLFDGQPVLASDGKAPLMSDVIFRDGVTDISFSPETTFEELAQLCDIWSIALAPTEAESAQTFTTRCWEASLNGIRIVSLDNFVEYLDEQAERELDEVLGAIQSERSKGHALASVSVALPRVGPGEAQRLRRRGLREIDGTDLVPRPSSPLGLDALNPEEAHAIAAEAEAARAKQSLPAITALAFAALEASDDERREIVSALGAVFVSIARAEGLEQVRQSVAAFVEGARTDSDGPQRRYAALPFVLDGLASSTLLSLCIEAISGPVLSPPVEGILSYLQASAAPALLESIASAPQPAAQILLPRFFKLEPAPEVIRARVARMPAYVAHPLLDHAKTLTDGDRMSIHIAAIAHADPEVRRIAASRVPREALLERPESLYPLANDNDPDLRQLALSVLLSTKDATAVPYLVQMLSRPDLQLPERRRVIRSLGSMPTREAVTALRTEFRTQTNPETAATCAMALGRAGDEFSRAAFEQVAAKRMVNPELKKACVEALRMLDNQGVGEDTLSRRKTYSGDDTLSRRRTESGEDTQSGRGKEKA